MLSIMMGGGSSNNASENKVIIRFDNLAKENISGTVNSIMMKTSDHSTILFYQQLLPLIIVQAV